jgi:hypothetical protein
VEQTLIDGLVCVDQVVGIDATRPPPLTGKPTYWVDRRGAACVDRQRSARRGNLTILHRNLIQTWQQPRSVGPLLRWLLVQLDAINAAGIVTTSRGPTAVPETPDERGVPFRTGRSAKLRGQFRFVPFPNPQLGHQPAHDYLNAAAQLGPRGGSGSTRTGPARSSTSRTGTGRRRIRTGTGTPRGRRSGSCARRSASYSARRTGSRRTR